MSENYDIHSADSIIEYAKKLKNKTLRIACNVEFDEYKKVDKGGYGKTTEKYYFEYEPNSDSEPDFKEAGIELKCSPLKILKNGEFRSKERLVLNIINYLNVHKEEFETSSFWKKNAHLLLIFYLHERDKNLLDYLIKLVDDWKYPDQDLKIIKHDWETINKKIKEGKAHELSEGDTFYLGACTKGSTAAKSYRKQPFNKEKAKQRAYSLKQGYVNHIIACISQEEKAVYGKIIKQPEILNSGKNIEQVVIDQFANFYGKTPQEIEKHFGLDLNKKSKNYFASLTKKILGLELNQKIEEFEKAEIQVKSIRIKEKNDLPKEHISFNNFKYNKIANVNWEESQFKSKLEKKFLFVFYKITNNGLILDKVRFWNMSNTDLEEVREVWKKTKQLVKTGKIVKKVKGNIRYTYFPSKTEHRISHVRPKAKNSNDCYPLPVKDKLTQATKYTKHCFWLNASYIRDEIYLKS